MDKDSIKEAKESQRGSTAQTTGDQTKDNALEKAAALQKNVRVSENKSDSRLPDGHSTRQRHSNCLHILTPVIHSGPPKLYKPPSEFRVPEEILLNKLEFLQSE